MQSIRTLGELFAARRDDPSVIALYPSDGRADALSFRQLYNNALTLLNVLQERGLQKGDTLILCLNEPGAFLAGFWAAIAGGIVPVPLSLGRSYEQHRKLFLINDTLHNPYILSDTITWDRFCKTVPEDKEPELEQIRLVNIEAAGALAAAGRPCSVDEDDIAYIQFSSGSTSLPKGVALTHRNLLTNCRAILANIGSPAEGDHFFSWMPLTHDMGLIGYHLTPFLAGWPHSIMSTELFIRKPLLWLELMSQCKATFTASPNFGYSYLLKNIGGRPAGDIDLSAVRIITNGAEPIAAGLCREFERAMAPYGLREHCIFPVYGLAEACLAVSFSAPGEPIRTVVIDRASCRVGDAVKVVAAGEGAELVSVGKALPGNCSIRIVLQHGPVKGEGVVGELEIKGDNVTSGYYNNVAATDAAITGDGWLRTGDLGFFRDGELFISGRVKDIFFINGQNFYPHDVEYALEQRLQLKPGRVAVCGSYNDGLGRDEVVVFVKSAGDGAAFQVLAERLRATMNSLFGIAADAVAPVKEIPKTTSGKLQRYKLMQQWRELGKAPANPSAAMNPSAAGEYARRESGEDPSPADTAALLQCVWQRILPGAPTCGPDSDFFMLGGTSLLAAEMLAQVYRLTGCDITLSAFYQNTLLSQLSRMIGHLAQRAPVADVPIQSGTSGVALMAPTGEQERLYYHWRLNRDTVAYNIPTAVVLKGPLSRDRLQQALEAVSDRYDAFRVRFAEAGGTVWLQPSADWQTSDLPVVEARTGELPGQLRACILPFDLTAERLYRVILFRVDEGQHIFFADFHHSIADGHSVSMFLRDILNAYAGENIVAGAARPADGEERIYAGQRMYQRLLRSRGPAMLAAGADFWHAYLGPEVPKVELPADSPRPAVFDEAGRTTEFDLSPSIVEAVAYCARCHGMTPYMIYLAAFQLLLSKLCCQENVVTGLAVSMRDLAADQDAAGMFTNSLAFRSQMPGSMRVSDLLRAVQEEFRQVMDHKTYPFMEIIRRYGKERLSGGNPVFDTMFLYQEAALAGTLPGGLSCEPYFFDSGTAKYDLSVEVREKENRVRIEYARALFLPSSIARFAGYYIRILQELSSPMAKTLASIDMLGEEERNMLLHGYNRTAASYPRGEVIHDLFVRRARAWGDDIALSDASEEMTYRELERRSADLAGLFMECGIGREEPVAILLERSADLIVAALAVLRAGGCFVPLDISMPPSRVAYILADCRAGLLVTHSVLLRRTAERPDCRVLLLDEAVVPVLRHALPALATSESAAYIIYTSGTTGNPKGVVVTHRSLVNYCYWAGRQYAVGETMRFAFHTSFAFDLTITSIFVPLISGGQVIVIREEEDLLPIQQLVRDGRVNSFKATPSHLHLLTADPSLVADCRKGVVRCIVVGGEAFSTALAREIDELFGGNAAIYNEYGPTEATVGCMVHRFDARADDGSAVPIGAPIANAEILVLDDRLQPVPYNTRGQLYVSGDCLAKEYLHQPRLTADRFVPHILRTGERMYASGDYARRRGDGTVEYLGRADRQVKLRGYRVELGEIEHALDGYPDVRESIVRLKNAGRDDAFLIAYILPVQGAVVDRRRLAGFLLERVQAYCLPRHFIIIDSLPLTANGKLDEQALPEPAEDATGPRDMSAATPLERHVAAAWQEVLKVPAVHLRDNFYWLGGDSIKAVQIAARLGESGIRVSARDILRHPVLQDLCEQAGNKNGDEYAQGVVEGKKALSPIEHWFFSLRLPNPDYFNQSLLLRLRRPLDHRLTGRAFHHLVNHHDALRLCYRTGERVMAFDAPYSEEEMIVQRIYCGGRDLAEIGAALQQSFDITRGPLIRMAILEHDDGQFLFVAAHHLVIDAFSWRILAGDFARLYTSLETGLAELLPMKTASLADWQASLEKLAADGRLQQEAGFWKGMQRQAPVLRFDTVVEMPGRAAGCRYYFLDEDITATLFAETARSSYFSAEAVLITALARILRSRMDSDLVKLQLEHHGRDVADVDVSRTIGWFTSIYPVIFELKTDGPHEQLAAVREQLNGVPRKGMGYGILQYLSGEGAEPDAGGAVIRFNYLGRWDDELDNELFVREEKFTGYDTDARNLSGYLLEWNCYSVNRRLKLQLGYDGRRLLPKTIDELAYEFGIALREIVDCISPRRGAGFMPADFDTVELDEADLRHLFS